MTTQTEALKLALEALEKLTNAAEGFSVSGVYFNEELWARKCLDDAYDAIGLAQEALAQPEQKMVSYERFMGVEKELADMTAEFMRVAKQVAQPEQEQKCWCTACRPITMSDMRFVVCPDCGNKRCPKANDHRNVCTGSNEIGQKGSSWENVKPVAQPEQPEQPEQEPVAWGIIASNTGRICQVKLDADEVEGHNPKHIVPLYTTPPQRPSRSDIKPLPDEAKAVIDAARAAMDDSVEAYDLEDNIIISSELAASLSLCLDAYDRAIEAAHGIKENT